MASGDADGGGLDAGERAAAEDSAAFVMALRERGVRDTAVLRAMEQVARERFAPASVRAHARRDIALPLPCGATMTAPTVVGAMLTALDVPPGARVLEVGTGSGYVTALLMRLGAARVRSLERYATLVADAQANLAGLDGATVETADGLADAAAGQAGYDRILVNGALGRVPDALTAALVPGGRLVAALRDGAGARLAAIDRAAVGGTGIGSPVLGRPLRLPPLTPGRAGVL